jgi:hypothetical protein
MNRIIYPTPEGGVAVIVPAPECELSIEEIAAKDVPDGAPYEIVAVEDIPSDRTFRNAWVKGSGKVDVDLEKARAIGHDMRRSMRAEEFKPHDEVIAKQIPGVDAEAAEAARQQIRGKYAVMQTEIDQAATPEEVKTALGK